jgi:hypothetical protein
MLEFNSEHKSMNGSLKAKKGLKVKNIIIGGMLIASILLFSGCSKDVECNISDFHAHYYVNDNSFDKFITGEKDHVGGWKRTEEFIVIDKDSEKLINFENKNDLFRRSYNQDKIKEVVSSQSPDYIEYRYKYRWMQMMPIFSGKTTTYIPIWHTAYSWTTNPERSGLTGEQRVVSRVYYGYKVVKDEKGNLQLVQSEMVDTLDKLSDDFIYIKSKFYKTVHLDNKDLEVDYEDGPEEQKPNYDKQKDYNDPEPLEPEGQSKSR